MIQAVVRLNGPEVTTVEVALPSVPRNGEYLHYEGKNYTVTYVQHLLSKMTVMGGRHYASYASVVISAYYRP
jgi:hypothetical protein